MNSMGKGRMFEKRERRELLENLRQWIEGWFALFGEKGEERVDSSRPEGFYPGGLSQNPGKQGVHFRPGAAGPH